MRRIEIAIAGCFLFLLPVRASVASTIPGWMRDAANQTLPSYPADTNAVVLLDDISETVVGPGDYVEHYRHVVKILRREGEDEGIPSTQLHGDEKVHSIHAWSLDSAGHEYEVKDKDFVEGNSYSFELYSDLKYRAAKVPAVQPGTVVGFEYEIRRRAYLNQFVWVFQQPNPVRLANFAVQLPAGWEYKNSWANHPSVEPLSVGDNRWQWTIHDVPLIKQEPRMPHVAALDGKMWFAFFGPGQPSAISWKSIGGWSRDLSHGRRNLSPEIADRVHQLISGKPDFASRLQALTAFLQSEVRYVAIEIGIGGFQPHFATDIFRSRYGDCKDKVTLLSAMLQEAAIRSEYVLISTDRGIVNPALVTNWFNHVIIAIELPPMLSTDIYDAVVTSASGTRYLLFDPTDEYTPVGKIRGKLEDSYALLVTEAGGELIHTPRLKPEANQLTRQGHFSLSADGTLSGEVVEDRTGDHALYERMHFAHSTDKERREAVERRLNTSLQGFTLSSLDIENQTNLQLDLRLSMKLTVPQYAQARDPLLLVRPRVIGEKSFALDTQPRHYDLVFDAASTETDTFELELPSGYKVDDLPDGASADFGFASYHSQYDVEGNRLKYSRKYTLKDLSVPAGKIGDVRKLESIIAADEHARVILKRFE